MAHVHPDEHNPYYLDQLCSIAISGALGGVAIMMYRQGTLDVLLHTNFHPFVLYGGIVLVILAVLRAVSLWFAVDPPANEHAHADHDHDHDHEHDHDHGNDHDHDHSHAHAHSHGGDHGHDHGWNPARYAVLLLPVMLFFLNMPPSEGFSTEYRMRQVPRHTLENPGIVEMADKGGEVINLDFNELDRASYSKQARTFLEGRTGRLKGQFVSSGGNPDECSLARLKIYCCAQDVTALQAKIISPDSLPVFQPMQWVEAEGQIQFRKRKDSNDYIPVLQLTSSNDIKPTEPDPNPYLQ